MPANVAIEIDGRPALEVFKDNIGEVLAQDLQRVAGYIFAAFPVAGSDRADYMVRNLAGLYEARGLLAIGAPLEDGQKILFCRRDGQTARDDLDRMLADLKRRATAPIKDELGDVPLVGFFCNGEISHNRVYSYTGVLSLFL